MNILFVCTGNTCRSPMAEKILSKKANDSNLNLEIKSAGISAVEGYPASKNAREIIKEYGLDDTHISKKVSKDLLAWADIILTMTIAHKEALIEQEPEFYNKVFTLKEYLYIHSEDKIKLEKLNKLYAQIELKKQNYYNEYKVHIEALENRYNSLIEEMKQIELELIEYNRILKNEIREEMQEIERIERNLPSLDIDDPFGGNLEEYAEVAQEIDETLEQILSNRLFHS